MPSLKSAMKAEMALLRLLTGMNRSPKSIRLSARQTRQLFEDGSAAGEQLGEVFRFDDQASLDQIRFG
jgi:hypothetical protein